MAALLLLYFSLPLGQPVHFGISVVVTGVDVEGDRVFVKIAK
jgi:hypothetical protein